MKSLETKLFVVIFLVGVILRVFALRWHDFWFDEAFTYHIARLPLPLLIQGVLSDNNPPLYYILIHFVLKLNSNEITLRLPSLIFNLTTLILLYVTLRNYSTQKTALIAASLFSFSPLALYLATEARLHSLAMLIVMILTTLFLAFKKKPTTTTLLTFIVVSIVGLYTHYYILLLFIPLTALVVFYNIIDFKKWLIILGIIATPLVPWIALSTQTTHNGCACPNTLISLPATLVSTAIAGVGEVTLRSFPQLPILTILFFSLTSITMLFFFLRGLTKYGTIVTIFVIPLLVLSFFGLLLPVFSPKAFSIFSPLYFGIVGAGIAPLRNYRITSFLLVSALGIVSILQITNPFFSGTPLKAIYSIIQKDQNIPVAHTSTTTLYSLNYYTQGKQTHMLITPNPLSSQTVSFIGGQQEKIDPNILSLWLVDTPKWTQEKDYSLAKKEIFANFALEKSYTVDKITVSYLRRK
ncbi:glycosyltransferase family 39 protein [Candidatus Microgenomates bacterium]|nr:glycosyltransferase family 39 protein [Candidatus Microgenomates bacterium]